MKLFSPRNRIAFGLTGAVMIVFCIARATGIVPSRTDTELNSRIATSEMAALSGSGFLIRGDTAGLESLMRAAVTRNEKLLSVGVRRSGGELISEIGDHQQHWTSIEEDASRSSQMLVPLFNSANEPWGNIELRFEPLHPPGIVGWLTKLDAVTMFCLSSSSFLLINVVLSIVLKQLDPSKAGVPKHVRDALNNFAEGLLLLDAKQNILLANNSFAEATGLTPKELVGKKATSMKFSKPDDEAMPWDIAVRENRPVANSRVHFLDVNGVERTYFVNCIPLGRSEQLSGMMVTFDDVTLLEESRKELSK